MTVETGVHHRVPTEFLELGLDVQCEKPLALEHYEFAHCIRGQREPEVSGEIALREVALIYAIVESGVAGRAVTLEDVVTSQVDTYQRELDEALGLVGAAAERP